MNTLTKAAQDVLAERQRQIEAEGWDHEHDDEHDFSQLADAAAVYALLKPTRYQDDVTRFWPWRWSDFKPKDRRSNLIRAAALLLAEIERLDRKDADGVPDTSGGKANGQAL